MKKNRKTLASVIDKSLLTLFFATSLIISGHAQNSSVSDSLTHPKKWLIEPLKITSLMVNTHPEYNGWGFEIGRKITHKIWLTSMIEKTQGGDFVDNYNSGFDYLVSFHYFAWLNTVRYYIKPDAKYSSFFDGGLELQTASHQFLRGGKILKEEAFAFGPILMFGGELKMRSNIYFKWRAGGFINLIRSGSMTERINDGQNQPSYQLYPHLSDAVLAVGNYAGDVAFGIKF